MINVVDNTGSYANSTGASSQFSVKECMIRRYFLKVLGHPVLQTCDEMAQAIMQYGVGQVANALLIG